jgi:Arc/MetJ-type ribon-helix-helix transcriptional regulator
VVSRSEFIRQHLALVLEQYRRHPKGIVNRRTLRPWSGTLRRELPFARTVTFLICADLAIANAARSSRRSRASPIRGARGVLYWMAEAERGWCGRPRQAVPNRRK